MYCIHTKYIQHAVYYYTKELLCKEQIGILPLSSKTKKSCKKWRAYSGLLLAEYILRAFLSLFFNKSKTISQKDTIMHTPKKLQKVKEQSESSAVFVIISILFYCSQGYFQSSAFIGICLTINKRLCNHCCLRNMITSKVLEKRYFYISEYLIADKKNICFLIPQRKSTKDIEA